MPWSALVVDDDPGIRQSLRLCLEADGGRVLGVGNAPAAVEALERGRFDLVLLDLWLGESSGIAAIPDLLQRQPDVAIIVITAFATFETAVEAMKRGACDYLPKPFTPDQVRTATRRALDAARLRRKLAEAEQRLAQASGEDWFDTENPAFRQVLRQAARIAASEAPVLIRGESGTGKNVLARWLWSHGARKEGPFASMTGASDLATKLQEADGGTLLVDEICDLSADAQTALLRFLDDRTIDGRQADVRVIATTNREPDASFRQDLWFRLAVVTLALPPLRDRPEDLLALARHYLGHASKHRSKLSDAAERALRRHPWPGNLRELRNAIERAVIVSPGPEIEIDDLGITPVVDSTASVEIALGADVSIDALEREHIARVVAHSPTLDVAARVLGIDPSTLQRKRKRYGLS